VARLIISMLGQPSNSDTVIVAPDEGLSIRSLAEAIARAMQFQGPIHFDTSQPEGVRIKRLESRRFEQAFPRFAFTSLEDGLTTAARWFVSTQPSVERQDLASSTGRQH
jgi:GDP-L-fucose synthase